MRASQWLLTLSLFGFVSCCWAAQPTCSINVQSVNFGSYDIFSNIALDSTGNIDVVCDANMNYKITLSTGAGTYSSRKMLYATSWLNYNLYIDAAMTSVWGDGTLGTAVINDKSRSRSYAIYGRIPARQNVYAGSYSDSLIVSVYF
ncbi:spore coat protein U domain-containing protein [Moraxellaceae bacterium AER2_44_116]|nr:spore coat protein U domain-containing protein [Moraxellaceae bacterium]TQC98473.1 spore coat protein U domain-containing protein [Moraxellaceae bacterium AER2_44_116]